MNTQSMHSTKVLDTTEAELLPKLQNLGFQEIFRGEVRTQLLKNPDNQKTLLVRKRGDRITLDHEDGSMEEVSMDPLRPGMHDFEGVITQLTDKRYAGRPLAKGEVARIKNEVAYILDQNGWDKITLHFETLERRFQDPIPQYLKIITPKKGQLDVVIKFLGLDRKERKNLTVDELYEYYKSLPIKK